MSSRTAYALLLLCLFPDSSWGGYKDDIGYTRLVAELGANTPTGAGIEVTQVEASTSTNSPIYMPDTGHGEFTGKTFTNVSSTNSGASGHATTVGRYFYGSTTSIAPGIDTIDNYLADDWLADGFLRSSPRAPLAESSRVQNHSWISTSVDAGTVDLSQRLDFAIDRDGFTSVVGLNNGAGTPIPPLLGHAYHAISVGRSDGSHSTGGTTLDGSGRTKPDLVAPISLTSYSTPVVAAAAALLLEVADGLGFSDAATPHGVKALLMAGATREDFPGWDRTPARPIDERFGAGELNIWRSTRILTAGSFPPDVPQYAGPAGWSRLDFTGPGQTRRFHFQVPPGFFLHRFGALVTWHRVMTDTNPGPPFTLSVEFNNLDVRLYQSSGFVPGDLVDLSTSQVDNVEQVYQPVLAAGDYTVEVSADGTAAGSLAWLGDLALVPVLDGTGHDSNGLVTVQALVTPGIPYQIEAATNVDDSAGWDVIYTGSSVSNLLEYTDPQSTNLPTRFYRFAPF